MLFAYDIFIIILMIIFNAFFAAYEMALASISRVRIAGLVNEKKRGAEEAAFMKDRMEVSLAVVQVGITLVGAFAAALGGAGMEKTLSPYLQNTYHLSPTVSAVLSLVFLVIPLSFIMVVFAELVPKVFALNYKEWVVLQFSPTMKYLSFIAYPVVSVLEKIVKKTLEFVMKRWKLQEESKKKQSLHELRAAASYARASLLLGAQEEKIITSAANMTLRPIREIMMPASYISMIPMNYNLAEAFIKAHMDMHTRFPVTTVENDPQSIVGYVNFKDILVALKMNPQEPNLHGISRTMKKVNENLTQSQLLGQMIQERMHIALVVNDEGVVLGMVTMEDIIEELVGEIEDEFDRLPTHIHPYGSYWIIGGGVPMNTVFTTIGLHWEKKSFDDRVPTLSEWCTQKSGGDIKGGEPIDADLVCVLPRKFRRRKLFEATVSLSKRPYPEEAQK